MHQKQSKLLVKKVSLNTRLSFNHMSNLRGSIFDQHQISDICRKTNITKKGVFQRLPHMTCGEKQNISQVLKGFEGNLRVVRPGWTRV